VFLTAVNLFLFVLQHNGMHTVNRIPGQWSIVSASTISNDVNERQEN